MNQNIQKNLLVGTETTSQLPEIDLNMRVKNTQEVFVRFENEQIKEATSFNGDYYYHNRDSGTKTIATEGFIVEEKDHIISIIIKKIDSDPLDAINELDGKTQKVLGAFAGKSQPWISQNNAE